MQFDVVINNIQTSIKNIHQLGEDALMCYIQDKRWGWDRSNTAIFQAKSLGNIKESKEMKKLSSQQRRELTPPSRVRNLSEDYQNDI